MDIGRRSVVGLGLAASFAGAVPGAAAAVQVETQGKASPALAEAMQDIAAYAAQHVQAYGLPGLTLAAAGPDGFIALVRLGYANIDRREPVGPDHLFEIGSISKSFTCLAIYKQLEVGRLKLEDDVATLLPGVPVPAGVTVRHLMDHSSGLADDPPVFPRGGDQRLWLGFAPGSRWSYSNLGYSLLSRIVERTAGRPFGDVLADQVLAPLGMMRTEPLILTRDRGRYAEGYAPFRQDRPSPRAGRLVLAPWTDWTEGAGCVASTGGDMGRYLQWLIAAARGQGDPVLTNAGAARFFKPTVDAPGWEKDAWYGAGLAHVKSGGRTLIHHTGGMIAFSSAMHVDAAAGVGCFASSNVGGLGYRPREITAYACHRLRAALERSAKPTPPLAPPAVGPREAYVGRYAAQDGSLLVVEATPAGLAARFGGRRIEMVQSGATAFAAVDPAVSALPLVFRLRDKAVERAWWDGAEYVRQGAGGAVAAFTPPTPVALQRLMGAYANDDPWRGTFRVTAEGEQLYLDGVTRLTRRPDGSYRIGEDDWSPERLTFDAEAGGQTQRANFSGVDFLRRPV